jgi:predicted RNA-binding Zn-ribbon protein involved in translation (DUF1610 family)
MKDKDCIYQCVQCEDVEIVKADDKRKDGRSCKKCGQHSMFIGPIIIGIDLGKGESYTIEKKINVTGISEDGWLLHDYDNEG